jgi:hypothetical protein
MRDLMEHWELVLAFIISLIGVIGLMGKLLLWFLKQLLVEFGVKLEAVCNRLDKLVDKFGALSADFAELKGEHNANHGKR